MKIFSQLLILLAMPGQAIAHQFNHCGNSDNFDIQSVTLNPDPPEIGQELTVDFSGVTKVPITDGSHLDVDLTVLGIKIADKNFDLCQDLKLKCPLNPGDHFSSSFSYKIPSNAPSGIQVEAKINAYDHNNNDLTCISLTTPIGQQLDLDTYSFNHHFQSEDSFSVSEKLFIYWMAQHKWEMTSLEQYVQSLYQFHYNTLVIMYHNKKASTFTLGHNQFSHLSNHEFRTRMLRPLSDQPKLDLSNSNLNHYCVDVDQNVDFLVNSSVDWRDRGAVTDVKNQGNCGSCWAFSTTGAMEGAYYLETGNLTSFSEQQLVSCDKVDQGCGGGLMDNAFNWIHNHSGLCSEDSYPYQSGSGTNAACKTSCHSVVKSTVDGIVDVNQTERALKQALTKQPVSIAIEADGIMFQLYKDGVFSTKCGTNLDHGVLAVGYGIENGKDYWLVKNSWGEGWGDSGYIKLARGLSQQGGQCGILLSASYPVL